MVAALQRGNEEIEIAVIVKVPAGCCRETSVCFESALCGNIFEDTLALV